MNTENNSSHQMPDFSQVDEAELLENFGWTPEMARERLLNLGYPEDRWEELESRKGAHEWRAYVKIARGTTKRSVAIVTMLIRLEDGLPAIRELPPLLPRKPNNKQQ